MRVPRVCGGGQASTREGALDSPAAESLSTAVPRSLLSPCGFYGYSRVGQLCLGRPTTAAQSTLIWGTEGESGCG